MGMFLRWKIWEMFLLNRDLNCMNQFKAKSKVTKEIKMLQKYRLPFCAFMFALAAFFFAPLTASAAPQCPDTMPNRWCDNFTAKCDSGKKRACYELNKRSRAVDRMQSICDQRKGRHKTCWILKRLYNRKASMDKNYTPPRGRASTFLQKRSPNPPPQRKVGRSSQFTNQRTLATAPKCPSGMANRDCDDFTARCERGNQGACSQLQNRINLANRMKTDCKGGNQEACNQIENQEIRKQESDRSYRPASSEHRRVRERIEQEEAAEKAKIAAAAAAVEKQKNMEEAIAKKKAAMELRNSNMRNQKLVADVKIEWEKATISLKEL